MKKVIHLFILSFIFSALPLIVQAQNEHYIGAQIFIEPGQTPEQIESWFRLLHENGMNVCRIRMFEVYMKDRKEGHVLQKDCGKKSRNRVFRMFDSEMITILIYFHQKQFRNLKT